MLSKVGTFSCGVGATGTTQEISVGFQPKVVFLWWNGNSGTVDNSIGQTHHRGFGVVTGLSSRYCFDTRSVNASAAAVSSSYIHNAAVIIAHSDTTLLGAIDIDVIGATSFTLSVDVQMPYDMRVSYLALGGSDLIDAACGTVAAAASGDFDITGLSFRPNFAMLFGNGAYGSAPAGSAANSTMSFGFATASGTAQSCLSAATDDGSATMDAASYGTDAQFFAIIAGTVGTNVNNAVDFVSFTSDGFLTTPDVTAMPAGTLIIYVALNCTNVIVGNSLTRTDGNDIAISGLGWSPAAGMVFSHCKAKSTSPTMDRNDETSIGAFTSASERVSQGVIDVDAVADSNVATAIEYASVYVNINTSDVVEGLMDVKSIDAGGVTFVMDDTDPVASYFTYILFGPVEAGGVTKSVSDTGSGADALSLSASLSQPDSGIGVDNPQLSALLGVVDSVLGGDFIGLSASLTVSDAGSGIDSITILQSVLKYITDVGAGLDNISIQAMLSATESARGQDNLTIQASFSLIDRGSGVDNPILSASLGIVDGALGGDFLGLSASIPIVEVGSGADRLFQLLASLSVRDIGSGTDAISILTGVITKSISDSGLGSDQVSISVSLSVSDIGTGVDALTISASITILDTGTGVDAVTVSKVEALIKSISDIASGSDRVSISASLNIGETSYGIDDPSIQAALGLIDSGAGLESPQISAELSITDTGSAIDFLSILQSILKLVSDAGTGTDAITQISASIPVSESGLGSDQIGQILATLLVTDFGQGIDVIVKFDSTTNILSISFELRKPKIVATLSQPAISVEIIKPVVKFSLNR